MSDPFYDDIRPEQIELYQYCFDAILKVVDVANNTAWASSKPYDHARLTDDDEIMQAIIESEAARSGLRPSYLQIMINQFFFADARFREMHKDNWVVRVLHRTDVDSFPDGWSTRRVLEKLNAAS